MKTIGLDIGTTTISAVLLDTVTKQVITVKTIPNATTIEGASVFEKTQNAERILEQCQKLLEETIVSYPQEIKGIGVTGQMHGILYVDAKGNAVSPLYTWQDGRGNQVFNHQSRFFINLCTQEHSYATLAQEKTGYRLATGFGVVTHFYNSVNSLLPENAACFCTIADFVAMKLAGLTKPQLHPSMAAGLGLFDLQGKCFDQQAIEKLQLHMDIFPKVTAEECWLGYTEDGIGVTVALGDNQASFLGAVRGCVNLKTSLNGDDAILLNIGTGSQISIFSEQLGTVQTGEYRPYLEDSFLWVGSPLCGGYSYHMLKEFFIETLQIFGATPTVDLYEAMNQAGKKLYDAMEPTYLSVDTRFKGTRDHPDCRGSITNIAEETWRPDHLILGFLKGICRELYEYYQEFPLLDEKYVLIGSGNGLRKNPLLQQICSDMFDKELIMSMLPEEAACGSAFWVAKIAETKCSVLKKT